MLYQPITVDHPLCVFTSLGNTGADSLFRTLSQNLPQHASYYDPGSFAKSRGPSPEILMALNVLLSHLRIPECEILKTCKTLKRNFELVTMVRDPVKHFISNYNWRLGYFCGNHLRGTNTTESGWLERRKSKSKEWLASLDSFDSFIKYCDEMPKTVGSLRWQIKNVVLRDNEKNSNNLTPDYIAKLLFDHFRFVGITELFEETVFALCKLFNWPIINEPWVRNGPYTPKLTIDNLSKTQISHIERILADDIKVYNLIRENFEDYFCGEYTIDDYSDYKANCIAADQQICTSFLLGSDEYIPKKFFLKKNKMDDLKFSVLSKVYSNKSPQVTLLEVEIRALRESIEMHKTAKDDQIRALEMEIRALRESIEMHKSGYTELLKQLVIPESQ